ncbi:unnamed protein product, partial [Porites lobata]
MSIPDDYLRACEGGDHLARDKLRHDVLIKRLDICLSALNCVESVQPICVMIMNLKGQLSKIAEMLAHHEVLSAEAQNTSYSAATASCKEIRIHLETSRLPQHKPIDIQTTDAGPGVSTNEKMSQLRLAECFMINGLDLQARFHYAP